MVRVPLIRFIFIFVGVLFIFCSTFEYMRLFALKIKTFEKGSKICGIKQEPEIRIFGPLFDPLAHKCEAWKLGNAIS
jgi:hypothetical protein